MENRIFPAIYILSPQGMGLALRIRAAMGGVCFASRSLMEEGEKGENGGENASFQVFDSLPALLEQQFHEFRQHIFIAAAGLVVRCLAPLLAGKAVDPAVVVLDHHGEFVISLLSGHLGGANALARQVAAVSGGQAVITTATDAQGLPAPDLLALRAGLRVLNPPAIRTVNAALLAGKKLALHDPEGWLRNCLTTEEAQYFHLVDAPETAAPSAPCVRVTWRRENRMVHHHPGDQTPPFPSQPNKGSGGEEVWRRGNSRGEPLGVPLLRAASRSLRKTVDQ